MTLCELRPCPQKRTFSDTLSNVCFWGQSGHKTDPPPASRYAIVSPRSSESNFFGNLWRGKWSRAYRLDFSRGKVDRLVVVTEVAMRLHLNSDVKGGWSDSDSARNSPQGQH